MKAPVFFAILGLTGPERGPPKLDLAFDSPPVLQWVERLPVPAVNAASHAELGRPVIHGDHVFLGAAGSNHLLILDRRNGDLVARLPTGGPVQAAAVFVGERLWFSDSAGYTFCYDLQTALDEGPPRWKHHAGAPLVSAPAVDGGRVYLANVEDQYVALDADSGELIWRYAWRRDASRSVELILYGKASPVPVGGLVLVGTADGTLVALGADDGSVVWQRRVGEGKYPDIIGAPTVVGDRVLVGGYSQPLVALDLATRDLRWRLEVGGSAPVVLDPGDPGRVYQAGGDGHLRAIDALGGAVLWDWDSGDRAALTAPVPTPAGLLVTSTSGLAWLVDAATGALRWQLDLGVKVSGIPTSAAVSGRQALLLTNAGNLVSLVVPSPVVAWPEVP